MQHDAPGRTTTFPLRSSAPFLLRPPILSPEPRSPPPEPAPGRPPGPRNPALPPGTPLPARPDRGAGSRSRLPKWSPEHIFAKTSKSVAPAETLQYYFVNVTRDHLAEHTPDPRNPALPPGTPLPARPDRCAGSRSRLPKWSPERPPGPRMPLLPPGTPFGRVPASFHAGVFCCHFLCVCVSFCWSRRGC